MPQAFQDEVPSEVIRELLSYDPATGLFRWRVNRGGRALAGSIAGTVDKDAGCLRIGVTFESRKFIYKAHRLAWVWMTGEWPPAMVDHRDLDRLNNRWANLRSATRPQNASNSRPRRAGKKGAYRKPNGRWSAQIRVMNKTLSLGSFATEAEAHQRYAEEARRIRGEFARTE